MDKDEITDISKKKIPLLILFFIFILFKNQIHHVKIKIFYFFHNKSRRVVTKDPNELINIFTQWGSSLKKENILQEYPRSQFKRISYLNLNGEWDYSLNSGIEKPKYKRKIIVPFPIESPLSGVKKKILQPSIKLWYRKIVDLTKIKNKGRFLLLLGQ